MPRAITFHLPGGSIVRSQSRRLFVLICLWGGRGHVAARADERAELLRILDRGKDPAARWFLGTQASGLLEEVEAVRKEQPAWADALPKTNPPECVDYFPGRE